MTRTTLLSLAAVFLFSIPGFAQVKPDVAGCKDPSLFPNRMPKYRIEKCESKPYERFEFYASKGPKRPVDGEFTFVQYAVDDAKDSRSGIEVVQNYTNALTKIGGKIVDSSSWWVNGYVVIDKQKVWVQVERGNSKIWMRIIKEKAMDQIIVADAASFANDLKLIGHVAVGGIYFDTASSVLKPESTPALAEIAKLLKGDPSLKVFVVGHTDTVGNVESNLKLSQERAAAVIAALTSKHGIAASRLRPFGNGPFAPVASNGSEDGRAKNRRVELVTQ